MTAEPTSVGHRRLRHMVCRQLPGQHRQPDITFGQSKRSSKTFVWLVGPRRLMSER